MRRLLHAIAVRAAAAPWAIGIAAFWLAYLLALLADRIWPDATHGNCWSYAGPRWVRHGGYLLIRWADDVPRPIVHVSVVHRLPDDVVLEQFVPIDRKRGWRGMIDALYYRGEVTRVERPHPSSRDEL